MIKAHPHDPVFNYQFQPKYGCTFSVVAPPELPLDQKYNLISHLEFSSSLKETYLRSEALANGLISKKRKSLSLRNQLVRNVVFSIRRLSSYETLRSNLEGLMFEQVPSLDKPCERYFHIQGVKEPLKMTHVYFSKQLWEFETYESKECFDDCEHLTEADIMIILSHINNHEVLMWKIKTFYESYTGRYRLKWKYKLDSNIRSIMRVYKSLQNLLLSILETKLYEDSSSSDEAIIGNEQP